MNDTERIAAFIAWVREQRKLADKSAKEWQVAGDSHCVDYRSGMWFGFRECENFFTGVDAVQRQQSGAALAKAEPTGWKARAESLEVANRAANKLIETTSNELQAIIASEKARAEKAETELRYIDEVLARRPVLDDLPYRNEKIERIISVAKRADEMKAELDRIKATTVEREKVKPLVKALEHIASNWSVDARNKAQEALNAVRALGLLEDGK